MHPLFIIGILIIVLIIIIRFPITIRLKEVGTYIVGDFTASYDAYSKLTADQNMDAISYKTLFYGDTVTNLEYNLLNMNCAQVTMDGLYLGILPSGTTVKDYHEAFWKDNTPQELRSYIPVLTQLQATYAFQNNSFTREGALSPSSMWHGFYSEYK